MKNKNIRNPICTGARALFKTLIHVYTPMTRTVGFVRSLPGCTNGSNYYYFNAIRIHTIVVGHDNIILYRRGG